MVVIVVGSGRGKVKTLLDPEVPGYTNGARYVLMTPELCTSIHTLHDLDIM